MTDPEARTTNPAWDPAVRRRVQRALNELLFTAQDVLTRYGDKDGFYVSPDPVPDGDVTGIINSGYHQVVKRLEEQIAATKATLNAVQDEVDAYKRELIGPGYQPVRKPL
jgi:hypothetical protein